jgi:hypothetical protein
MGCPGRNDPADKEKIVINPVRNENLLYATLEKKPK